jgi:hypothetical protein
MQRFIDAAVEHVCKGKRLIYSEIAIGCGLAANRPWKWNAYPEFKNAMRAALEETHGHLAAAARTSLYQMAIAGNLAAYDRIREVERDIAGLANGATGGGANVGANDLGGVHFHVHGVPERQPLSTLPPTLTLPAPSAAAPVHPAPTK